MNADANDQPLKQSTAAADHVEVPEVDRVVRAGADRDSRVQWHTTSMSRSSSPSVLYTCGQARSRPPRAATTIPAARHSLTSPAGSGTIIETMPDHS